MPSVLSRWTLRALGCCATLAIVAALAVAAEPGKTEPAKFDKTKTVQGPPVEKQPAKPTDKTAKPAEKPLKPGEKPTQPAEESPKFDKTKGMKGPPVVKQPSRAPDPAKSDKSKFTKGPAVPACLPRDPSALVAALDADWSQKLAAAGIPMSAEADDAEFLRRTCLDLTGVLPTYQQTIAFLGDDSTDKRRRLVDELLMSRGFADHMGRIWRKLIWPPDYSMSKSGVDRVTPWIAEQFQSERPWSEFVIELLTTEAKITHDPTGAFYMANMADGPQPNLLANSAGRLFLGVQIGCAECHNHPFSHWKQEDFWALAACFSRVRKVSKSDFSLTEDPDDPSVARSDPSITIPEGAGKGTGKVVPARFLGNQTPLRSDASLRRQLADWVTARDNPYFAKAMANRVWAHLFGRGIVNPIDDLRDENPPSHPELLAKLAEEFTASNYDVKHLYRSICLSKAYGRTSRTLPENAADTTFFSHMAVKVMNPDMLYDSLHLVMNSDPRIQSPKPGQKGTKPVSRSGPVVVEQREPFVRFFSRAALGNDPLTYGFGIPQMLRLLNSAEWNVAPPFLEDLSVAAEARPAAIETICLVTLSRRPDAAEVAELSKLVTDSSEPTQAYAGVFWVLVNGAEFVVNR